LCEFCLSAGGFKYVFPRTRVEPPALGVQIATFCQRKRRAAPDQRNSLELAVFPLALGPCVFALQLLVRAPFFFSFSAASSSFCTSPLPSRSSVICLAQRPIAVGCRQHAGLRSVMSTTAVLTANGSLILKFPLPCVIVWPPMVKTTTAVFVALT
jgi:hypothetical protein